MARTSLILLCLGAAVAGCSTSAVTPPPDEPVLRETTLTRHDGTAISLEELESMRYSAIATAETISRIEHGLREPWAEQRTPEMILDELNRAYPSDMRLARTLWETAEPRGFAQDRGAFNEFGFYSNQMMPNGFAPRARPATLEKFVSLVLDKHTDADPTGQLLAAWRRFSPGVAERQPQYLASSWTIELDYAQPVTVTLCESLLGPHQRCGVENNAGVSFPGPQDQLDGYTAPALLLDLVLPGPDSPVVPSIDALSRLSDGESVRLPFTVAEGKLEKADDSDLRFMQAALHGLRDGNCGLSSLPAAARRVSVTYSYLVNLGEARASLSFERTGTSWVLDQFEYEPAAATLLDGRARLDLLPTIRDLVDRGRRD
ncbi:MAG: hypothetical protein H6839_05565 [Planctomycetes bacterium]|nr:hypothetical protein [Planctomycetota bacterium]